VYARAEGVMSMLLTRSPLEVIGMNGAQQQMTRRSARLSTEGTESENEPPRRNGVHTTSVGTKQGDGGGEIVTKKKRKGKDDCLKDVVLWIAR
jgi:kinetochore protein Mis13/DSN1